MLLKYIRSLFQYAGSKAWGSLSLMILLGLTQGIGLVMIIPFLQVIGIESSNGVNGYAEKFAAFMAFIGVKPGFFSVICTYLLIVSLHAFATRFKDILTAKIVNGFTQHLRNRLYSHFCHADWLCFLRTRDADIIHVITADIQRVASATQQFFQLIVSGILVMIHILFSFTISVPMTFSALICGSLFLFILRPFNKNATRFGISLRQGRNDMYTMVTEHIGGMKVSKSYNLEEFHKANFNKTTADITTQMVHFTKINTATRLCYQVGAASAIAVFIVIGVKWVKMPAVNLMVIVFLFTRILPGFSNLQQGFQRIANAMPSFRAVINMEEKFKAGKEPECNLSHKNFSPITLEKELFFDSVSFRYDKTLTDWTLTNIKLKIPANKMTAITGHSGAGKSSIADMILGLLTPDQGGLYIDGEMLSENLLQNWREVVGYVPQETFLFHESIRDNLIKALPTASESQLWEALEQSSALKFVSSLPKGLDTLVGDRGIKLSGGERQRIALARALLRKPLLLVMDEATSSLDNENEQHIQDALDKLQGKLTIVVIAHRFSTIQNADHVVVLDKGMVAGNDLFFNKGVTQK